MERLPYIAAGFALALCVEAAYRIVRWLVYRARARKEKATHSAPARLGINEAIRSELLRQGIEPDTKVWVINEKQHGTGDTWRRRN